MQQSSSPLNPGTQAIGVPELVRRVQVLGARVARVEAEYRQHHESQGRARSRSRVRRQSVEERLLVLENNQTEQFRVVNGKLDIILNTLDRLLAPVEEARRAQGR